MNKHMQRLYHSLLTLMREKPYFTLAALSVLAAHLSLMIYSQIEHAPPLNPNRKKLIVKTMILPPETPKSTFMTQEKTFARVVAAPARAAQKKTIPASEKKVIAKSNKPTPSSTQKTANTPTPHVSKTKKLLSELQESIAKIETNRDNILPAHAISVPTPITELKADSYEIRSDAIEEGVVIYRDLLIHHLKDALHLPGYGTVKVELSLTHEGHVQNVVVVYSDSEVNRLYLEHTLQDLQFPSFIGELSNKKTYTFCLTFCSDQ